MGREGGESARAARVSSWTVGYLSRDFVELDLEIAEPRRFGLARYHALEDLVLGALYIEF
eukprot:2809384-Rhodomonas_salina.1